MLNAVIVHHRVQVRNPKRRIAPKIVGTITI